MEIGKIKKNSSISGFTLLELVVVISIVALIYTVILGNRGQYQDRLLLKNEAYNVLLALRQAQVNSLGVISSGGPIYFNTSYGVSMGICRRNKNYLYSFTDQNLNGKYDDSSSATPDPVSSYNFPSSINIKSVNGTLSGGGLDAGARNCGNGGPGSGIAIVDILFRRPDPSAQIKYYDKDGNAYVSNPPACIQLQSSTGLTMAVRIDVTGQITVQNSCP